MGKVRTEAVKNFARNILKKHPEKFDLDFYHNKRSLSEVTVIPSGKLRNRIAGYITRLKRVEQEKQPSTQLV